MNTPICSPTCPRCAYDLSGHTASWESTCPVEGQCSECGLEFAWRVILREDEQVNPRYIEHCPRRAIPIAAARTLLWCILPWVFWKRVELRHEPRVGRMVLWLGLFLLVPHAISSGASAYAMWRMDVRYWQELGITLGPHQWLVAVRDAMEDKSLGGNLTEQLRADAVKKLNAMMLRTPYSLQVPGFGPRYLIRASVYPPLLVRDYDDLCVVLPERWDTGFPGSQRGVTISAAPMWKQPASLVGVAGSLCFPLLLVLLPATRQKLRIRAGHIARAGIFGCAWLVIPSMLRLIESVSVAYHQLQTPVTSGIIPDPLLLQSWHLHWPFWSWLILIWVLVWWLSAIWQGFQFASPLRHWAILGFVVLLLVVVLIMHNVPYPQYGRAFKPSEWFVVDFWSNNESTPEQLLKGEMTVEW